MILHQWRSSALKNYGDGHIIVLAASPDEAREKARVAFQEWLRANREWLFDVATGEVHEWDRDDVAEYMTKFEADIAAEPQIRDTILIAGSD